MSRTSLNAAIDGVAYAGFVFLAATGLMLRYQLPPGSGRLHGAGSGAGAAAREISTVWNLSRHDWGSIHYYVALGLMSVLAVHLLLHWKWIACVLKGKPHSDVSGSRFALGVAGLVLVTLLAALPFGISAQTTPRSRLEESSGAAVDASATESTEAESASAETIRGFMTLEDVAQQTGVPVADILERLDLPPDTKPTEKIGRLLRSHGLDMPDLKRALKTD